MVSENCGQDFLHSLEAKRGERGVVTGYGVIVPGAQLSLVVQAFQIINDGRVDFRTVGV